MDGGIAAPCPTDTSRTDTHHCSPVAGRRLINNTYRIGPGFQHIQQSGALFITRVTFGVMSGKAQGVKARCGMVSTEELLFWVRTGSETERFVDKYHQLYSSRDRRLGGSEAEELSYYYRRGEEAQECRKGPYIPTESFKLQICTVPCGRLWARITWTSRCQAPWNSFSLAFYSPFRLGRLERTSKCFLCWAREVLRTTWTSGLLIVGSMVCIERRMSLVPLVFTDYER
jgi:hypothetical protein